MKMLFPMGIDGMGIFHSSGTIKSEMPFDRFNQEHELNMHFHFLFKLQWNNNDPIYRSCLTS